MRTAMLIGTATRATAWSRSVGKRLLDLALGSLLCVVALPLIGALAVILAAQHRGNPFFSHLRVGMGGRPLAVPKLRTLDLSTPSEADKTLASLVPISRLAAWLRRTHLDELPQLLLVPIGRMTLVGPRPRMVSEVSASSDLYFEEIRTRTRQGCTGLWQVGGATSARVSDHPEYDLFYLTHSSARLDAWILWRTVRQLVGGRGVPLEHVPRWTLRRSFCASHGLTHGAAHGQAERRHGASGGLRTSSRKYGEQLVDRFRPVGRHGRTQGGPGDQALVALGVGDEPFDSVRPRGGVEVGR